jgi:hypothetical protein
VVDGEAWASGVDAGVEADVTEVEVEADGFTNPA